MSIRQLRKTYFLLAVLLASRLAWYFWVPGQGYQPGSTVALETVLDREPEVTGGRQVFRVDDLAVYAPIVPELHFGDRVEVAGKVECNRRGRDCSRKGIYKPTIKISGQASFSPWTQAAFGLRGRFIDIYQSILPRDQASLLSGVVLGSVGLDRQFKDKLANVGLTHVVAASGMNISLFSGFVAWLVLQFRWGKLYSVTVVILLILFYSTITGFEPPIVRAGIMATGSLVGAMFGRQRSAFVGLLVAGYVMLWVSPRLVASASFLLSFFSMMGQITLSALVPKVTVAEKPVIAFFRFVARDFLQAFSSVLFTVPIVLLFFSRFSLVSLLTNTLVLWTVEPLMILGATAGILGLVWVELARAVVLPASALLAFFLWVVEVFGRDERWLLRVPGLDWTFFVGYYLILGAVVWWWRWRQ